MALSHLARISCTAAALTLAFSVAGCGGGGGKSSTSTASTTRAADGRPTLPAPSRITRRASLLGGAPSAGASPSYAPTGNILTDSGFRPDVDGFGFENYGNDAGPINLRPANVEDLFGNQVCAVGTGASCQLIPSAKQWMEQENAAMADGHCMGFSVTALRFFTRNLKQQEYGATRTVDLPVQGNQDLQSLIAENFAYQDLAAVQNRVVDGTPTAVLRALAQALGRKDETYTLGIFKADGSGGHALTPFAIEDRGSSRARILVYDNNFPGVIRAVDVDAARDTWRYVGGINPSDTDEVYAGDARTQSMFLLPTSPGEGKQPCPFCPKRKTAGPTVPVPDQLGYVEVVLSGYEDEHPHLVFTDPQGRRTGYVGGAYRKEIPGIKVIQSLSVRNWSDSAEPKYRLPLDHPKYEVTVDGSALTKATKTLKITTNGNGVVFSASAIHMDPGQKDTLTLPHKALAITYATTSAFPTSATLGAQFPQFDIIKSRRDGKLAARLVTMVAGGIGVAKGSPLTLRILPKFGIAQLEGGRGEYRPGVRRYVVGLNSYPLTGRGERDYLTQSLKLGDDQTARFHYLRPTTKDLPVDVVTRGGKVVRRSVIPGRK